MGIFSRDKSIDAAGNLIEKAGNAFDKLFTSEDEKLSHKEVLERLRQRPLEMAHELNLIGAGGNWFNSGWRPALGWVGAVGVAMFFIPQYAIAAVVWCKMAWAATGELPPYPVSDAGLWQLITLLISGKMVRTYEKREVINS